MNFVKKRLKPALFGACVLAIVSGCQSNSTTKNSEADEATAMAEDTRLSEEQNKVIHSLSWVHNASVKRDLENAVSNGDFRVFVLATRGLSVPGIDVNERADLVQLCGQKYLPGVGDIIINEQHKSLYQKALKYAESYNQQMVALCRAQKTDH